MSKVKGHGAWCHHGSRCARKLDRRVPAANNAKTPWAAGTRRSIFLAQRDPWWHHAPCPFTLLIFQHLITHMIFIYSFNVCIRIYQYISFIFSVEFFPQGCFKHYEMLVVALTTKSFTSSQIAPSALTYFDEDTGRCISKSSRRYLITLLNILFYYNVWSVALLRFIALQGYVTDQNTPPRFPTCLRDRTSSRRAPFSGELSSYSWYSYAAYGLWYGTNWGDYGTK